jgi:glycosyltransferase involved in cell wall biosynthesis
MKISIITINYNNKDGLKKTIESVIHQSYDDIEYIIIDGGSTDGSTAYIREKQKHFSYWVSEPDSGVYNAMNKGIDRANGEYLLFLNSGDYLADENVIKKFVELKPIDDLVYGDVYLENSASERKLKKMPNILSIGVTLNFTITHQAIFHKKILFESNKRYDEQYKIISDWVFYNNVIIFDKRSYKHIDLVVSIYDMHGMSENHSNLALMRDERAAYHVTNYSENFRKLLDDYKILSNNYRVLKNKYNDIVKSRFVKIALGIRRFYFSIRNKVKKL